MSKTTANVEQRSQVKLIRWSLAMVATEFDLHPKTVKKRVSASGILPGEDGRFSTADVHRAICGDYERERTRKMKEDADKLALENATARGELVELEDLLRRWEPRIAAMAQRIEASALADTDKDALKKHLADCTTILEGPRKGGRETGRDHAGPAETEAAAERVAVGGKVPVRGERR